MSWGHGAEAASGRARGIERMHARLADGAGLAFGADGFAVVLITRRLAERDGLGKGQLAQKGLEVGGILAGGIEADVEVRGGEALLDAAEELVEALVADVGFRELGGGANGLEVVVEEGDVVAIACGIEADANDNGLGSRARVVGHGRNLQEQDKCCEAGSREHPPQSRLGRGQSL